MDFNVDIIQNPEKAVFWAMGGFLVLILLWVFKAFIGAFVVALFFYYAARPIHNRLSKKIPESASAALSLISLIFPVFVLLLYTFSIGVRELLYFLGTIDSSQFKQFISPYINYELLVDIQAQISAADYKGLLSQQGPSIMAQTGSLFLDYFGILGAILLNIFIIVVVSYYLLKDGSRFISHLENKLTPDKQVKKFFRQVDSDFQTIFFGNLLNALLTASIGILSFLLLEAFLATPKMSIYYPVLLGLLCGLGSLVPIIGMKIVYAPVAVYLFLISLYQPDVSLAYPIIFVVVSAVVIDGIPDLVLRPYISQGDLHLGMVMLSYILGPILFGWYGLFFGPMLLVVLTHFYKIIVPYLVRENRSLSEFT